jgi:hypothetical protein
MTALLDAPPDFQRRIHKALKCWHDRRPQEGLLDDLLIAQRTGGERSPARRLSTNQLLQQGLAQLALFSPLDADLLDLRFCNCLHVSETRQQIHYAESTIYHKQNQAIGQLAAILYRLETAAWQERLACLEGRLGTSPAELIGAEAQITHLAALLTKPAGPRLLSIEGMGGSGKTALAAALLRRLAKTTAFAGFGWVSAQVAALDLCGDLQPCPHPAITSAAVIAALARQLLPDLHPALADSRAALDALRLHLRQTPHLIVIDHWETVIDPQTLLLRLRSLADPSRFILTSRRRLIAESGVHLHCVPELSKADALLLMRRLAHEHGLAPLLNCADAELAAIYAVVGGNPLALMLVLGQLHIRSLHAVLAGLAHSRTPPLGPLFDFVLRPTWEGLDERARCVLVAMPLAERRNLDVEGIGGLCGLSAAAAAAALQHLVRAGLISTSGDLDGCRYLLHNLTRTFLQQEQNQANKAN